MSKGFLAQLSKKLEAQRVKPLEIKNPVLIMYPEEIIELRRELQYHPALVEKLGKKLDDLPTIIGVLAGEVGIAMDGEYTAEGLCAIADLITKALRDRRGAILIVRTGK